MRGAKLLPSPLIIVLSEYPAAEAPISGRYPFGYSGLTLAMEESGTTMLPVLMSNTEIKPWFSLHGLWYSYRTPTFSVSFGLILKSSWRNAPYSQRLRSSRMGGNARDAVVGRPSRKSA